MQVEFGDGVAAYPVLRLLVQVFDLLVQHVLQSWGLPKVYGRDQSVRGTWDRSSGVSLETPLHTSARQSVGVLLEHPSRSVDSGHPATGVSLVSPETVEFKS